MSFTTRKAVIQRDQEIVTATAVNDDLSTQELEYLLEVLKNVDLKGYQVETFYNLVVKIQNQYLRKTKQ